MECAQLCLEWTLTDRDEAHVRTLGDDDLRGREQIRVSLRAPEVRDRTRRRCRRGPMPSSARTSSRAAGAAASTASTSTPYRRTRTRGRNRAGIESRTAADTATVRSSRRTVNALAPRVNRLWLDQTLCSVVTRRGRSRRGSVRTTRRAHAATSGECDMNDVDGFSTQPRAQAGYPPEVPRAPCIEAGCVDTEVRERADQGVLVRQEIRDAIGESAARLPGARDQQLLRAAVAQALDEPQDPPAVGRRSLRAVWGRSGPRPWGS